jgi:hypothetical protein
VSLFVLSPEIEDRDEVEVANWVNHKKIGHLTRSSRLWTFQLLGFEVLFQVRLQKKALQPFLQRSILQVRSSLITRATSAKKRLSISILLSIFLLSDFFQFKK